MSDEDQSEADRQPKPADETPATTFVSGVREEDEEEDFTGDTLGPSPVTPPTPRYDPEPARERMRGYLALLLATVFSVVVIGSPVAVLLGADIEELKAVLEVILPPMVALTGTAMGFYFAGGRGR